MLKMVKTLAKALKGIVRPKTTTVKVAIPQRDTVPTVSAKVDNIPALVPTRDELIERMARTLQSEVDRKVKAFVDAVENYPARWQLDEWLDDDGSVDIAPDEVADLVFSLEALGFRNENWICGGYEYDELCAAIEYHQQNGEEITVELIADVVEALQDGEYVFFPGVEDDEDLGCALTDEFQNTDAGWRVGWLIQAVDWKRLGEDWRNEEGGCFTSRGYFQFGRLEF